MRNSNSSGVSRLAEERGLSLSVARQHRKMRFVCVSKRNARPLEEQTLRDDEEPEWEVREDFWTLFWDTIGQRASEREREDVGMKRKYWEWGGGKIASDAGANAEQSESG